MESTSQPPDLPVHVPADYDEDRIEESFWPKIKRVAAKVPGVSDILALYFYLRSGLAPVEHKLSILATLLYFILPTDAIPDFLGAIGYTDDIAVALGLIKFIGADVMKPYRAYAKKWLRGEVGQEKIGEGVEGKE